MSRRLSRNTIAGTGTLCLLLACLLQAQHADKKVADPMAEAAVQRGRAVFVQNCAMCHGTKAKGSGEAPSLIDSPVVRHDEHGEKIGGVIREGRPTKGMPAFGSLTPDQIADITAFLHVSVEAEKNRSAGSARGYVGSRFLTGNADAGRAYFNGPGGCVGCHSPAGDLKGIATRIAPLQLEGRMLYPSKEEQSVIVTLRAGTTYKGKLVHLDPFIVSLIDASGIYHSWQRDDHLRVEVQDPLHEHEVLLGRYTDKDIHDLFAYLETLR